MGLRHSVKREEEEKEKNQQARIQRFIERTLTDGWVQAALGAGREGEGRLSGGAGSSVAWVLTRHRLTMDDVSC